MSRTRIKQLPQLGLLFLLGVHAVGVMAKRPKRCWMLKDLVPLLGCSHGSLALVMKRLRQEGILKGVLGSQGGYALARPAARISLLEISDAVEGPLVRPEGCGLPPRRCVFDKCLMADAEPLIQRRLTRTLSAISVALLLKGRRLTID